MATGALLPEARRHAQPLPSLKAAASRIGLRFGSDSDVDIEAAPASYQALFIRHCDLLAPSMSWGTVEPTRNDPMPAWEDPNVAFARRHGLRLTGAHLLWHENSPAWFRTIAAGAAARAAVDRHIDRMVRGYAGQVFAWNVVNEAIDTSSGDRDGLRRSVYADQLGPGFIAAAFRTARAADPDALLVYNDTRLEMDAADEAARRDALLRLLDRLRSEHVPIDGVGLQTHLRLDDSRFNASVYRDFLRAIAGRGLKILITEMDVLDLRGDPATGRAMPGSPGATTRY